VPDDRPATRPPADTRSRLRTAGAGVQHTVGVGTGGSRHPSVASAPVPRRRSPRCTAGPACQRSGGTAASRPGPPRQQHAAAGCPFRASTDSVLRVAPNRQLNSITCGPVAVATIPRRAALNGVCPVWPFVGTGWTTRASRWRPCRPRPVQRGLGAHAPVLAPASPSAPTRLKSWRRQPGPRSSRPAHKTRHSCPSRNLLQHHTGWPPSSKRLACASGPLTRIGGDD